MGTTPSYVWVYHANISLHVKDTRSQNHIIKTYLMRNTPFPFPELYPHYTFRRSLKHDRISASNNFISHFQESTIIRGE